jgi:hypothetical protein
MFIDDTFAFGHSGLISGYLNTFVVDFANQVLFDGWRCADILPQLLYNSAVGRHTDVVYISGAICPKDSRWYISIAKYLWTHPTCRPNGQVIPVQCPLCLHYRSWKVPKGATAEGLQVVLTCHTKGCAGKYIIPALTEYTPLENPMAGIWKKLDVGVV